MSGPELPDQSRQYLSRIERAANRMDSLTRDLLQFSTISRQNVDLTPVDLTEVVQDLQLLRPALQDGGLDLRRPLHAVLGHRTLLQQCISNIFDNALKFIAPDSRPRIVVWSELIEADATHPSDAPLRPFLSPVSGPHEPSHDHAPVAATAPRWVRLWVEDNGIGIAPEARQKIFGIFERLNAPDKYEGTGIGLAIVARAMQRMGGICGVESGPQQGSRFWLQLHPAE
jgi:signal transduction histidine kinase